MKKDAIAAELGRVGLPPRGLSREQAAAYIGVSPGLFDAMVADGRMPSAKRFNTRRIWDRHQIDKAFSAIPDETGDIEADDVWSKASV